MSQSGPWPAPTAYAPGAAGCRGAGRTPPDARDVDALSRLADADAGHGGGDDHRELRNQRYGGRRHLHPHHRHERGGERRGALGTDLGTVSISDYDLAGDFVRALTRCSRRAGDCLQNWDGRTSSGRVVARGVSFVRIVGPGVDEGRSVLAVR